MAGEENEAHGDASAHAASLETSANSLLAESVDASTTPSQDDVARGTSTKAFVTQYLSTFGGAPPCTVRTASSFQETQTAAPTNETDLPITPPALPSPTADLETADPPLTIPHATTNGSSSFDDSRLATTNLSWQSPRDEATQAQSPSQEITPPLTGEQAQASTAAGKTLPIKSPAPKIPLDAAIYATIPAQAEKVTATPSPLKLPQLPPAGAFHVPARTATQAPIRPKPSPHKFLNITVEEERAKDGQAEDPVAKPPMPSKEEMIGQPATPKPIVKPNRRRNQPAKAKPTKKAPPKSQPIKGQSNKKKPAKKKSSAKGQRAKAGQPTAGTVPTLPSPRDEDLSHTATIKRLADNSLSDLKPSPNKRHKKLSAKKKTSKKQMLPLGPANEDPSVGMQLAREPVASRLLISPVRLEEFAASPLLPIPLHGLATSTFWPIDSASEPCGHSPVHPFQLQGDGNSSPWYMVNLASQITTSKQETGNEASVTGNQKPVERDPCTPFPSQATASTNVSSQKATKTTANEPSPFAAAWESLEQGEYQNIEPFSYQQVQNFERFSNAVLQQVRHAKETAARQEWMIHNILRNRQVGHEGPALERIQQVVSTACWQRACNDTHAVQQSQDVTSHSSSFRVYDQHMGDKKTHEAMYSSTESTLSVTGKESLSAWINETYEVVGGTLKKRETQAMNIDAPSNRTIQAESSSEMTRNTTNEQKQDPLDVTVRATLVRADNEHLPPVLKEAPSTMQLGAETPSGVTIPSLHVLVDHVAKQDEDSPATEAWKKSMDTCPHIAQLFEDPPHQDTDWDEYLAIFDLPATQEASENSSSCDVGK